ncbi:PAAR domain-containing protein [Acinetobacter baumannii]|uniref:PAAR domain-containing protein n=1 Tax=Acinetobacter baumannii TaxID=470 RepID=UPI002FBDA1B5
MAKGFAIHNAITDHGGVIPSTQSRSSQMGNLFVRAGDGHMCPKCRCWSVVIKSHDHIIMDGKPVAYAGDKLSCGATIQPQQSHVVGDSGSPYSAKETTQKKNFVENNIEKKVTEITWSYGNNFNPLSDKSRFFNDLNIHVKTTGYSQGENVSISIEPENSDISTFEPFAITIKVDSNGEGILKDVFSGKTLIIDTEY